MTGRVTTTTATGTEDIATGMFFTADPKQPVSAVMTTPPIRTVSPEQTLEEAVAQLEGLTGVSLGFRV